MRFQAILNLYKDVGVINGEGENEQVFDKNGDLIIIDQAKVTEEVEKLQSEYNAKQYQRDRAASYPELKEQLDLLWHAIDGGKFNVKSKDTDFYKKLKAVKDANPKPE